MLANLKTLQPFWLWMFIGFFYWVSAGFTGLLPPNLRRTASPEEDRRLRGHIMCPYSAFRQRNTNMHVCVSIYTHTHDVYMIAIYMLLYLYTFDVSIRMFWYMCIKHIHVLKADAVTTSTVSIPCRALRRLCQNFNPAVSRRQPLLRKRRWWSSHFGRFSCFIMRPCSKTLARRVCRTVPKRP